jgi:hypothetical protein
VPTLVGTTGGDGLRRWVAGCAAAECLGMTAAAAASLMSHAFTGDARTPGAVLLVVSLAVAGGVVEGAAVGYAQHRGLVQTAPSLDRRRFVALTTLVAGLGWAAASAPAALAGDDNAAQPARLLVLGGAAGLGAVMGSLLGAAQAWPLRGLVARPGRWVGVSAAAWTPTMVIIFAGATTPSAAWPPGLVLGWAAATGLVAGAVLGAVSGALAPLLHPIGRHAVPRTPTSGPTSAMTSGPTSSRR